MIDRINYAFVYLAQAIDNCAPESANATNTGNCAINLPEIGANQGSLTIIIQLLFGVIGALAVFFIILGGFKFITSQDEPQAVAKARNTILYAVIGLVIALSAEFIVTFVLKGI